MYYVSKMHHLSDSTCVCHFGCFFLFEKLFVYLVRIATIVFPPSLRLVLLWPGVSLVPFWNGVCIPLLYCNQECWHTEFSYNVAMLHHAVSAMDNSNNDDDDDGNSCNNDADGDHHDAGGSIFHHCGSVHINSPFVLCHIWNVLFIKNRLHFQFHLKRKQQNRHKFITQS